jgi:sulfatase maturation enzyme AslB (radical SAM superfamily)
MATLKQIIDPKIYRAQAGPDWPKFEDFIAGAVSVDPAIQQELDQFVREQTENYQAITLAGDTIALDNQQRQQQVFFNKQLTGVDTCRVPWNTLGVNSNGQVYICLSPSWIPKFVGNILQCTNIYDVLNSTVAQQIRQEILAGRYYYCNNRLCGFFGAIDSKSYTTQPVDKDPLPFVSSPDLLVDQIPSELIFDFDYTCNFKCPSCRTEVINWNKDHVIRGINNGIVHQIKTLIIDRIDQQPVNIRWCGGEPFISEVYVDLMNYIVGTGKTNIQSTIQTNGSYLKKHAAFLSVFLPHVNELRISFDAGTAETYSQLRANGDWNTLLANVRFVKQLIDQHKFTTKLTADFVVQTDNYKEIPEFVKICQDIGITNINLQKMWNWGTTSQEEFDRNNIYNPSHPEYDNLKQIFESVGRRILF